MAKTAFRVVRDVNALIMYVYAFKNGQEWCFRLAIILGLQRLWLQCCCVKAAFMSALDGAGGDQDFVGGRNLL